MIATNSSGTSLTYGSNNCGSRLPCGLCLITNRPCPFVEQTITPTWKITCEGKTDGDSVKWTPDPNVNYTATNAKEGE